MEEVLRTDEKTFKAPIGLKKVNSQQGLANFVSARPPIGAFLYRLQGFSKRMKVSPTPSEKLLYTILHKNSIKFKTQVVISPYIVDCLIPQKKIIIEMDGEFHSKDLVQNTYDTKRDGLLMSMGMTVLRINNKDLNEEYLLKILNSIKNLKFSSVWSLIRANNKFYPEMGFLNPTLKRFKISLYHLLKKNLDVLWYKELGIRPVSNRRMDCVMYHLTRGGRSCGKDGVK